jgi:hypothetical protein
VVWLDGWLVGWLVGWFAGGWRIGAVLGVEVVLSGIRGAAAICMAAIEIRRPDVLVGMGLVDVLED